jgi:hypothetical protein
VKRLAGLLLLTVAGSLAMAQEGQTLKERLSDKASDDQRVDNCHVPVERRGTKPRPDCPEEPRPPAPAAEEGGPAAPRAR